MLDDISMAVKIRGEKKQHIKNVVRELFSCKN